ncbi:MAG: polyamine aminopropyltransferase [Pseudomonadota bacterium]|nr:polyamine aminopropyltransferase [Pseudomonadota bacterium]
MPDDSASGDLLPGVLTEYLTDDYGFFVRSLREFERFQTPYQTVEVHDTRSFGKLFRLDGHLMTSEKDEFFYHENLVHVAAITHPAPETALIIGGGDGGSAEELLKYQTIKSLTLVEIDLAVLDIARKYFAEVHRGSLADPRLTIKVEDGLGFVRSATDRYDLIVLDLTDPGGASEPLYGAEFYRACAARLNPTGAISLHVASPVAHPERVRTAMANLRAVFSVVVPYLVPIPLYGGMWMMACASPTLNPAYLTPLEANRRVATRGIRDLQYYNGEVHRASMALPNFVRELVA